MSILLKNLSRIVAIFVAVVVVSACQTQGGYRQHMNQDMSTLIGAGLGALAGSQIGSGKGRLAAVAIGALGGAWVGNELGRNMDRQQVHGGHHHLSPPAVSYPFTGYGFAQCEALGSTSQARADCIRAIADERARQEERATRWNRNTRY